MGKPTSGPGNLQGTGSLSKDVNADILKETDQNKFTIHAYIQVGVRPTVTLIRWHKPRPRKRLQMLAGNLKASQGGKSSACDCVGVREHTHAHSHSHAHACMTVTQTIHKGFEHLDITSRRLNACRTRENRISERDVLKYLYDKIWKGNLKGNTEMKRQNLWDPQRTLNSWKHSLNRHNEHIKNYYKP